ncbi:MAG TPA: COX15/CtaA family protein [Rhizomicrobium sp.]|nr:COX15/CtaA family protein [Rhizomicrobium sp.]
MGIWLLAVAAMIAAMVVVGGLTRLTGSGLSITEWHPVTGAVPPLSDAAWAAEFAKYKHIPQYRLENRGMSLGDFKSIYWWEWTHRLLGRLIGFVFLLPFLFFAWRGDIPRARYPQMLMLFVLGGLQGFVGWWMVQSGLETRVSVSQYRLAIHLGFAVILLGAILWVALEYLYGTSLSPGIGGEGRGEGALQSAQTSTPPHPNPLPRRGRGNALAFVALVYVQMLLGALVAGLHAGLIYNTWPSMDGRVFPENPLFNAPWWINFFENPGLAQFDHRTGAYIVAAAAIVLWISARKTAARMSANAVLGITALQITLGILTLLNQVPIPLAALHQITAVALYCAAVWHCYEAALPPQVLSA